MKNKFAKTLIATAFCSLTLMIGNAEDVHAKTGTVTNADYLNLRANASNNGKILTALKKGTTVTILNSNGAWDYIQYGSKKGYVYDKYITYKTTTTTLTGTLKNASSLNVRQSSSINAKIIAVLDKSDKVNILNNSGTWYKISFNGKVGYVNGKYIKTSSSNTSPTTSTKAPTTNSASTTYKVIKNDTLYKISNKYNMTVNELKKLNNLKSNLIKVGQTLKVKKTATSTPVTTKKPVTTVKKNLSGKLIVLDPGHGDSRPGAVGNGIVEKTLNYDVALKVKKLLEEKGATVKLTRIGDTDCNPKGTNSQDLLCRANVANKLKAHAFLSIHGNSGSSTATGAETFYYKSSSKSFASAIQSAYVKETGMKHRRTAYGDLGVLRNNNVPAALVELGFISNKSDAAKLKTEAFKNKAATGIVKGFESYFGK